MTSNTPQPGAQPTGGMGIPGASPMPMRHTPGQMGQMMPAAQQPHAHQMMPTAQQPPSMQAAMPWSMTGMVQAPGVAQQPAPWMVPLARPAEETYVENILRMNRGKVATVYTTNENNPEWAAKVFTGRVENAARDHVVLSDPTTGTRYIILMINIDYITFAEPLTYEPGFYRM